MARTATKTKASRTTKSKTTKTVDVAPKKKVGRPLGSKNRVVGAAARKPAPAPVTKKEPVKKAALAVPASKMSKADLEAQIDKLERALARSRKQNAELSKLLSEAGAQAEAVKVTPKSATRAPKKAPTAAVKRRGKPAPVDVSDDKDETLDHASGEDETEAHAS